jgi:two-component sensor histidine kinase/DNA-binding LacI/PurR family transcriptional regulator
MLGTRRPVIGLLASSTVEPWAARQWEGVVEAARDLDVELVSYIGGVLRSARYDGQANVMYDLAASARLDGLIVWSTALGWLLSRSEMAEFLSRFGSVPLVSMEMGFPGVPTVSMDDYGGMRAMVDHLIDEHGRRRIAFLRGPVTHEGHEARFRAYRDSLADHGLPLDDRLVSRPSIDIDGASAIGAILDSGSPAIDAIVGADDVLVLAALPILRERGLRVPEDVSVAGFDNMPEDLTTSPPLTSADPPFREMGRRAMEIVLGMIAGRPAPEAERLPIGFVRRRSCGCPGDAETEEECLDLERGLRSRAAGTIPFAPEAPSVAPAAPVIDSWEAWESIAAALRETVIDPDEGLVRSFWDLFAAEVRGGEPGSFLPILERELERAADGGADPTRWLRVLVALQRATSPWTAAQPYESRLRAGELWGRAQEFVARAIQRQIARKQVSFALRHSAVRMLNEKLARVYDLDEQMDLATVYLARMEIDSCYLSLFDDPENPTAGARLVLAYGANRRFSLAPAGIPFAAPELVPYAALGAEPGPSRLALALYFGRTRLGFAVFEISRGEDALLCEILRWQLSGILKSAQDIRAEKAAAAEKAMLLRELQHRVKNSISLIASIAGVESSAAKNPETKEALSALEARISAIGGLYEELFDSGGVESVDLAEYLERVVAAVAAGLGGGRSGIVFDRNFERCPMDLKRAISLGLIVNELVTDSLKHAFPSGRPGRIDVRLVRSEDSIVVEVRDDGVGFPQGFDPTKAQGFGLQMVSLLARQIDGELAFDSGPQGTRTTLRLRAGDGPT